jgi:hypothetical protein
MDTKRHITKGNVFLFFLVSVLCGCGAGQLSSEQRALVDRQHVTRLELSDHARRVSISPLGILEVETTKSQEEYAKGNGQRTLIDLQSMARIWSGSLQEGYMITDAPSPIIVKKASDKHTVARYDRQGQLLWETAVKGLFVFGLGIEKDGMLLFLCLQQTRKDAVHAIMNGIRLDIGMVRWRRDLGAVSLNDDEIGSLWRYNNRPIFAHGSNAFLLLENRAICMSVTSGKIYSDWQISLLGENTTRGDIKWLPLNKDLIVVSGAHVILMSKYKKRNWHTSIGKMYSATDALLRGKDLIIAFNGNEKRGAGVLDMASKKWRWKTFDDVKSGVPPKGLGAVGNTIVIASKGNLHGFNANTGAKQYTTKLQNKNVSKLLAHDTNIILIGSASIECRNASNGELRWSKNKIVTPLDLFYSIRKSSMASIQLTMQASSLISANMSRSYYGLARQRIGGSYAYDPFSRMQYTRMAQSAGRSAAVSNFGASLAGAADSSSSFIDRKISIIVDMQNEEPLREWAYFVVPLKRKAVNFKANTAKLLGIRLSDGSTREFPIRTSSTWCVPTAMVCEELGFAIEAYNKFPFCKQSQTIDIYRLPDTFLK